MEKEKVALVKLVTGEEIFCTLKMTSPEEENSIIVNFPVQLYPNDDGRAKFYPWLNAEENMQADAYIPISPMSIVTVCTPTSPIVEAYVKFKNSFFSKIIQPTPEEQNVILNKTVTQ